jgi:hypothetical protein
LGDEWAPGRLIHPVQARDSLIVSLHQQRALLLRVTRSLASTSIHLQQHMARAKCCSMLAAAVLCLALCSAAAAAAESTSGSPVDPAAGQLPRLAYPVGSGQNKPLALGRAPARGRLFARLMQQLAAAARAGDLEAAQQIQSKLWEVTRRPRQPAGHRRALLQAANPVSC